MVGSKDQPEAIEITVKPHGGIRSARFALPASSAGLRLLAGAGPAVCALCGIRT
jgi:hypothetical protein